MYRQGAQDQDVVGTHEMFAEGLSPAEGDLPDGSRQHAGT